MPDKIVWSPNIRGAEKELIEAIGSVGSAEAQRQTLIETCRRWPLAGFLVGASCAAPLLRWLFAARRLDIHGFCVEVASDQAGIGKSTGNELAASVWGNPSGLARTFDRTAVAWENLLYLMCDMPVFLEETQLSRNDDFPTTLVYMLALGMGRERGSRTGGMRQTKSFYNVALLASERSIKSYSNREGVEARVLSLPPIFGGRNPAIQQDIDDLRIQCVTNYGHAGRQYAQYLVDYVIVNDNKVLLDLFDLYARSLKDAIPEHKSGELVSMAGRMASRVATCGVGLQLLMNSLGVSLEEGNQTIPYQATHAAWKYILENTEAAPLWKRALGVIQSWAAENVQRIAGMEPVSYMGVAKPPSGEYIASVVNVKGAGECIGFFPNALNECIKKYLGTEGKEIQQAFLREKICMPDREGNPTRNQRLKTGGTGRVICIPVEYIFPPANDSETMNGVTTELDGDER